MRLLHAFLWLSGWLVLFWWPLSHWVYPDWYHHLLGFENYPHSLDPALVKIIGTLGVFPVLAAFCAARNPVQNRDLTLILIVFSLLLAATYIFLIVSRGFPALAFINVGLLVGSTAVLTLLVPRPAA